MKDVSDQGFASSGGWLFGTHLATAIGAVVAASAMLLPAVEAVVP